MSTSGGTPGPVATVASTIPSTVVSQVVIAEEYIYDGPSNQLIYQISARTTPTGDSGQRMGIAAVALYNGATFDAQRTPKVFTTLSAVAVGSEATIWTPTSGKKFRLMGFVLDQGTATGAITFRDNTAGTTIFILGANTVGIPITVNLGNGILSAAANNVLTAQGVATETLTGTLFGTEE